MVIGNINYLMAAELNSKIYFENCIFAPFNRGLLARDNGSIEISNCFFLGADLNSKLTTILDVDAPWNSINESALLGQLNGFITVFDSNQDSNRMEKQIKCSCNSV
jgi:hypothetical protein